jgi:hypothetical protein
MNPLISAAPTIMKSPSAGSPRRSGLSYQQQGSLLNTLASAHRKIAAYGRPAAVDGALHRVAIQGRAPRIVKPVHYRSAPLVLGGQVQRYAIFAHQEDFQPATTGFTGVARYVGVRADVVRFVDCAHIFTLSHADSDEPDTPSFDRGWTPVP